MLSSMTVSAVGAVLLVLFGIFYWLRIFHTAGAICAFVGMCLVGTSGVIGGILAHVATWAAGLANHATVWAFGVGAGAVAVTLITAVIFIHDLMPKHAAGRRTGWAGIVLALLLITGVSGITAANSIPGTVRGGVTNVRTIFGG